MDGNEVKVAASKFELTVTEAAYKANVDIPNQVVTDYEGNEEWFYSVRLGGRDEHGVYVVVLEGPAQGERVYVD